MTPIGTEISRRVSPTYRRSIERVEQLSDAYHLRLGDADFMVAYLLEVEHGEET